MLAGKLLLSRLRQTTRNTELATHPPTAPMPSADRPVIAHVLHRLYLAGAEVLAAELSRKLSDRYRFVFFCLDDIGPLGTTLTDEGFTVVNLARQPGVDLRVARRMGSAVREHGVDLLHAHQYTPFFYASLSRGLPILSRKQPPILFTEHGRHYPDQRKTKRILANRFLLGKRDRVTAVGSFIKQALVANEGIAADRIEVIHNGINPARFAHGDRAAARRLLGIADDELAILQVARLHPVKDHVTAIRAMADVAKRMPKARLLVGDGECRADLETLISKLNLQAHVTLVGVRDDVPALMPAADVFLLSSLSEGISVTLLEAMATGLPIAATDVGGNSEVVAHNHTGLLSPRRDAPALAHNLVTLLSDADLRQTFGSAGHARLLDLFTESQMHDNYAQLYQQMLSR